MIQIPTWSNVRKFTNWFSWFSFLLKFAQFKINYRNVSQELTFFLNKTASNLNILGTCYSMRYFLNSIPSDDDELYAENELLPPPDDMTLDEELPPPPPDILPPPPPSPPVQVMLPPLISCLLHPPLPSTGNVTNPWYLWFPYPFDQNGDTQHTLQLGI